MHTGASAEVVHAVLKPLCASGSLVINTRVRGDPPLSEIRGPSVR